MSQLDLEIRIPTGYQLVQVMTVSLQEIRAGRWYNWFYRACLGTPYRWQVLGRACNGLREEDEGRTLLPRSSSSLNSFSMLFLCNCFFRSCEALCRVVSTFQWRLSLYLSTVWTGRVTSGSSGFRPSFWGKCKVSSCWLDRFFFVGIRTFECGVWWNLHAQQARL